MGIRIQIQNHIDEASATAYLLQVQTQPYSRASQRSDCNRAVCCWNFTLSQFGIGVVSISQFTVAVYALAQFAFAYSLIAQFGVYIHEGHGQLVKSLSELLGML